MKKLSIFLIISLVLLTALSCSRATPPAPPSVDHPAPTETPTTQPTPAPMPKPSLPTPTPLPKLEVKWKTNGPLDAAWIDVISIDDEKGEIIYALGGHKVYTSGNVWKSIDGGDSWKLLGHVIVHSDELNFQEKQKIHEKFYEYVVSPPRRGIFIAAPVEGQPRYFEFRQDFADNPTGEKRDPNNQNIILKPKLLNKEKVISHDLGDGRVSTTYLKFWEFLLSFDNGKSFFQIDFPSPYLEEGIDSSYFWPDNYTLISSNGTLKIFFIGNIKVWISALKAFFAESGRVWKVEISLL